MKTQTSLTKAESTNPTSSSLKEALSFRLFATNELVSISNGRARMSRLDLHDFLMPAGKTYKEL